MSLMDLYPELWRNSPEFVALQEALDPEAEGFRRAVWAARDQLCPTTATWGLKYWEQALGIEVDESREADFRRSRIKSKLRGAGVTTTGLIKSVAESFSNGLVDVLVDAAAFAVTIKFVGTIGVPPNLEDLTAALKEIMPAHLDWVYEIIYNTWAITRRHTWGELKKRTWKQVMEEAWT